MKQLILIVFNDFDNSRILDYSINEGDEFILNDLSGDNNNGEINGAIWIDDVPPPPVYGCTDEFAGNFNSNANIDDGSCYGYPNEGDYDLIFDGVDDHVEIVNNGIFTNSNNVTNDFTINLSFVKYPNVQDYEGTNLISLGDGTVNGKRLSIIINEGQCC